MSAWSHVVISALKMSARTQASMFSPDAGSVLAGTLWKNDMAPRQNGTCKTSTPFAFNAAYLSLLKGMSPLPKSL